MTLPASGPPDPIRVLIVEDDTAIATILAMLLCVLGFDAAAVGDGAQALDAVAAGRVPHAWLIDIRLPSCGPDGVELARLIRARPEWAHAAIILMTAESYEEDATTAEAGADAFFHKPIPDADTLVALIRGCVGRRNCA